MNIKNIFLKFFICFLLLVSSLLSFPVSADIQIPTPTTYKYLNDYTHLINETELNTIISIGKELEDKTGAQAVIVVIDSTNNIPIEDYAINLFRTWGIGQKNKDNGLLILLAVNDRAWRVEVGRGLEGAIPDALSNRVMESIAKPNFIDGKYGEGLISSYSTFCDYIAKEYNVTLDKSLNLSVTENNTASAYNHNFKVFGGILIILLLIDFIFNRGRISLILLQIIFLNSIFRGNGPRGGSSGGGFGGFGDGSSGGGGSSGNW